MKIFLDSVDINEIKKWAETGLIDGVTTNPSLLAKLGRDPKKVVSSICALLPKGQISLEVTEKDPDALYKQAQMIAGLAPNIVVKIPCHADYYPVIHKLVKENININVTLVFTLVQALMMCKLNVLFISPFIGRWDDIDVEGSDLLFELRNMIDQYGYGTEILAASIRSVRHFHKAIQAGSDIVTLPPKILEQAITHVLTDQGMEKFEADWKKANLSL